MKTSMSECWQRALDALSYIEERSAESGKASVSKAEFARELNSTVARIDYTLKQLMGDGFVVLTSRHAKNGGTLSNEYRITEKAKTILSAYEDEKKVS